MTAQPEWSPVDDETSDLLSLVASGPMSGHADREWDAYLNALTFAARADDGTINPNTLRHVLGDQVKPQRVGAFTHRALRAGLIAYTGEYVISDDKHGGNAGKPCRELRWIGGDL